MQSKGVCLIFVYHFSVSLKENISIEFIAEKIEELRKNIEGRKAYTEENKLMGEYFELKPEVVSMCTQILNKHFAYNFFFLQNLVSIQFDSNVD